jgi:hypothetical protein
MYQCFLADAGALEHGPRHLTRHARPPKHTVGFFDAAAATAPGSGGGHPSGGGSRAGQQAAAAPPRRLRAVSFNVHFFRRGYSDVALSDSTEEVLAVVKQLNPDLLFLQEVIIGFGACATPCTPLLFFFCVPLSRPRPQSHNCGQKRLLRARALRFFLFLAFP